MNFNALVDAIADIHRRTQRSAARSVNIALTCRNWLIGAYIHEYELQGQDRAEYGEQLIQRLADALRKQRVPACERPRLYAYLSFYRIYPQISEVVLREWDSTEISTSDTGEIVRSKTGISSAPGSLLVERLSYTHLELLAGIDDPLKRAFYEIESIKGNWAVRELKRQIGSPYFERSGVFLSHMDCITRASLTTTGLRQ